MRLVTIALPGAAGIGVLAGFVAFVVGVATGSELLAGLFVVALPPFAIHALYLSLPRVHRVALGAVGVAAAAATAYLGVSGYST